MECFVELREADRDRVCVGRGILSALLIHSRYFDEVMLSTAATVQRSWSKAKEGSNDL